MHFATLIFVIGYKSRKFNSGLIEAVILEFRFFEKLILFLDQQFPSGLTSHSITSCQVHAYLKLDIIETHGFLIPLHLKIQFSDL